MVWSTRLIALAAGTVALVGAGLFSTSPAEARHWRHGFFHPGFHPRPVFYQRPFFAPPPPPVHVVRPVAYSPPPPPPVTYGYGYAYGYGYRYRKPVKHRHAKRISQKPACVCKCCPDKPAATEK